MQMTGVDTTAVLDITVLIIAIATALIIITCPLANDFVASLGLAQNTEPTDTSREIALGDSLEGLGGEDIWMPVQALK